MPVLTNNTSTVHPENVAVLDALPGTLLPPRFKYHVYLSGDALYTGHGPVASATVATLRWNNIGREDGVAQQVTQLPNRMAANLHHQRVLIDSSTRTDFVDLLKHARHMPTLPDTAHHARKGDMSPSPSTWFHPMFYFGDSGTVHRRDYVDSGERMIHHGHKSSTRVVEHFRNLKHTVKHATNAQSLAEGRGEFAATQFVLTLLEPRYHLKLGKARSGGQNGIDQIWVRRADNGDVLEYLIVEAKGSRSAHLGDTARGEQMSPRWIFYVLLRMSFGDGKYVATTVGVKAWQQDLARKILAVLFDETSTVQVRGLTVHSLFGTKALDLQQVIEVTDCGDLKTMRPTPGQILTRVQTAPVLATRTRIGLDLDLDTDERPRKKRFLGFY